MKNEFQVFILFFPFFRSGIHCISQFHNGRSTRIWLDLFPEHSWYFRNALVRANYRNYARSIEPEFEHLEKFFRNLLLGENNELKNRYLIISAPETT